MSGEKYSTILEYGSDTESPVESPAETASVSSKSQFKYLNLKKTAFKEVLENDITEPTRKKAREELEAVYLKAMNVPSDSDVPESLQTQVKDLEAQLWNRYKKQPREYVKQLARLLIFIDPTNYIGQFADLFRSKMLQAVYTPFRLVELDVTDMLPEVFLNPKSSDSIKLSIYQGINQSISETMEILRRDFNMLLNPTARIPTRPLPMKVQIVDKKIIKNKVDVKDLCENPYWKMKKVNMIICKEKGKFYCLDIEQLLSELAEKNTASNYFTGNSLSLEIIDNLRNRYKEQIKELKATGSTEPIGHRTIEELEDLGKTLEALKRFKNLFNQGGSVDIVELGGLSALADPSLGGKRGALSAIPNLVQEEFEKTFENKDFAAAAEQLNLWLDSNIEELERIVESSGAEDLTVEEILDVPKSNKSKAKTDKSKSESESKSQATAWSDEEQYVHDVILKPGTVTFTVFKEYIQRLEGMKSTIVERLRTTTGMAARQDLNNQLTEVTRELRNLRKQGRSINGLKDLVRSKLKKSNKDLEEMNKESLYSKVYPEAGAASLEERTALEDYIKKLQTELLYLDTKGAALL